MTTALPTPPIKSASVSRLSLIVATLSTVIEWYDFLLYLYFASVIAVVFFGDGVESTLMTLAWFALSYIMRPLGAAVFGHIGDKFGRKTMMMLSMILMTGAMFATALLPTYAQIGASAGAAMVLLRCVMAFAVGSEYTGVIAYLLESGDQSRRGFFTSLAAAASEIGALIAAATVGATQYFLSHEEVLQWGWRIPFAVGGVLALITWVARHKMDESPQFIKQQRAHNLAKAPLLEVFTKHKSAIGKSFVISALGSVTYYIGIGYVPTYLSEAGNLSHGVTAWLPTIVAVAVIIITPLIGNLSDKVGRKPVLMALAAAAAVVPIATFWWMSGGSDGQGIFGAILLAFVAGGVSAVGPSATAEQFAVKYRLSGLALGATTATVLFGGMTPFIAHYLLMATGNKLVPAIMIAVVALVVLPIFYKSLKETAFVSPK